MEAITTSYFIKTSKSNQNCKFHLLIFESKHQSSLKSCVPSLWPIRPIEKFRAGFYLFPGQNMDAFSHITPKRNTKFKNQVNIVF